MNEFVRVYITDGTVVQGVLQTYDENNNMILKDAKSSLYGMEKEYNMLFIRSDNIKFLTKLDASNVRL